MAVIPFFIPANGTASQAVNIGISTPVAAIIDPNWTPAGLSALASRDGITFYSVQRAGNEMVEPVNPNKWADLSERDFSGATWLILQSGGSTALVPQTSAVTIELVIK